MTKIGKEDLKTMKQEFERLLCCLQRIFNEADEVYQSFHYLRNDIYSSLNEGE